MYNERLTVEMLDSALGQLTARDPDLARVVDRLGPPPLWARPPGFPTLLQIILEQQVSLASARAVFDKLCTAVDPLSPHSFLELDDEALRAFGFSRQKASYGRGLAQAIVGGKIDLAALERQDDATAYESLLQLRGVGPWTASIYLLMAMCRPDVWPPGDIALEAAAQAVKQLEARPTRDELQRMAEAWRPWRAVAARVLWHHYLSRSSDG